MDVASAKLIGAGLAAIGVGAAAAGVGYVFGSFLQSAIRNPAAADGQQGRLLHRLRRRRASRPDGVRRRHAHPVRLLRNDSRVRSREHTCLNFPSSPEVYLSQFLWLAIALGFIFFVIARGMVPKIQATVDAREQRIAGDLEAAQRARAAADETEAAWRGADGCRARRSSPASRRTPKQTSARETEAKVKAAADKINLKVESAEAKIRDASTPPGRN